MVVLNIRVIALSFAVLIMLLLCIQFDTAWVQFLGHYSSGSIDVDLETFRDSGTNATTEYHAILLDSITSTRLDKYGGTGQW